MRNRSSRPVYQDGCLVYFHSAPAHQPLSLPVSLYKYIRRHGVHSILEESSPISGYSLAIRYDKDATSGSCTYYDFLTKTLFPLIWDTPVEDIPRLKLTIEKSRLLSHLIMGWRLSI